MCDWALFWGVDFSGALCTVLTGVYVTLFFVVMKSLNTIWANILKIQAEFT